MSPLCHRSFEVETVYNMSVSSEQIVWYKYKLLTMRLLDISVQYVLFMVMLSYVMHVVLYVLKLRQESR